MIERREWIAMLARVSSPVDPVKATQAMLHYLPLMTDMPDAAFTGESLEHVAMAPQSLHIRTLREIKEPLQGWWKANRPQPTAIAASAKREDAEPAISPEERTNVARSLADLVAALDRKTEPQKPKVRAHVIPAEVLAEARAKLMAGRR